MDFFHPSSFPPAARRLWNSDAAAPLRFYGRYLRWPLLLVLLALAADKLLYYGALPLCGCLSREWDYARAERAEAAGDDDAALVDIRRALIGTSARSAILAARGARFRPARFARGGLLLAASRPAGVRARPTTQLALAEAALQQRNTRLARAALGEVSPEAQADPRYAWTAGQLELARADPPRAALLVRAGGSACIPTMRPRFSPSRTGTVVSTPRGSGSRPRHPCRSWPGSPRSASPRCATWLASISTAQSDQPPGWTRPRYWPCRGRRTPTGCGNSTWPTRPPRSMP